MKKLKIAPANIVNINKAASVIRRGGIVAFPTETVYGLGADVFNQKAVCRVFEVKKRPRFDPLIVHVASAEQALTLWKTCPPMASLLIKKFWPGPLSIVLNKDERVPDVVTAGLATVAVRMPDHSAALQLIRAAGCPIAAPSANLFGRTSPTEAFPVAEDLGEKIDMILDGGPSRVGVESTVVKIEKNSLTLLRPGGVTVEQIEEVTGKKIRNTHANRTLQSPGRLKSHYAPETPLVLMEASPVVFIRRLRAWKNSPFRKKMPWPRLAVLSFAQEGFATAPGLFTSHTALSPKKDLYQAASRLFQAMRKIDKMKPDVIVACSFPQKGIGLAISDRLRKASGGRSGWNQLMQILIKGKGE